jgi:D-glycero-alpha-D-manno-heptose 1-phosphate guanylyltransferase
MQAIILAGGFGTRLKGAVEDSPKPMAPVAGRPFLAWLLEHMQRQGITQATLCLHHQSERITGYFGDQYGEIGLRYLVEDAPMGTGGAIARALERIGGEYPVFALNGDSCVMLDYMAMVAAHLQSGKSLTLAACRVPDCRRYGEITAKDGRALAFAPHGHDGPGIISAGFYMLSPDLFRAHEVKEAFSFEADFLGVHAASLKPAVYDAVEYFIDIGTPEDYARAQEEIPALLAIPDAMRKIG